MSADEEELTNAIWWRRTTPPDNEVPVVVATSVVLGRTGAVAVALIGLQAYSNGVAFTIAARQEPSAARSLPVFVDSGGMSRDDVDERLLLGIELSDGRTASNLQPRWPASRDPDEPHRVPCSS